MCVFCVCFFSFRKRTRTEKLCISILSIEKKGKEASFFIEGVIMKGVNNDAKLSLFRHIQQPFSLPEKILFSSHDGSSSSSRF